MFTSFTKRAVQVTAATIFPASIVNSSFNLQHSGKSLFRNPE